MRVGLIGTGNIGYPLFQNFLRQQLKVNILMDPRKVLKFPRCLLFKPEQVNDFINKSDIIFSVLPESSITSQIVEQITHPPQKKKYWVDLCCSCPHDINLINNNLQNLGIEYMDAPISGCPLEMAQGKVSTVISGPITCYQKIYDIISAYNRNIFYISEKVGTATSVKIANNTLVAANIISVAEVLSILYKNNIDIDEALHFINNSSGKSLVSTDKFPRYILNNKYDSNLPFKTHKKDILAFLKKENLNNSFFLKTLESIYRNLDEQFQDHTEIVKIVK